jgi:hypothetical protein
VTESHPHSDATYKVISLKDGLFAIEVSVPGSLPTKITGFATKAKAEEWVSAHKLDVARGIYKRVPYRLRQPSRHNGP